MRHRRHPRASALLRLVPFTLLLAACGGGGDTRPEVEATFPARGAVLGSALQTAQIIFDTPVTILNPDAVRVRGGGVIIPVDMEQRAGAERSIFITPRDGAFFPTDAEILITVIQGAVIDQDQDYALDPFRTSFTNGPAPTVLVGTDAAVVALDPATLAVGDSVATPAGTAPLGIADTQVGADRRIWVLLEDGSGSNDVLAHYAPGDAIMSTVSLPTTSPGITVVTDTLVVGPRGIFLYATYTETDSGSTRVAKVDLSTRAVVDSITLSVPGGPSVAPVGAALDDERDHLLVSISQPTGGRLAYVELESFTELDQDETAVGIQARSTAAAAGPLGYADDRIIVGLDTGPGEVALITVDTGAELINDPEVPGATSGVAVAHDRRMRLQSLSGYDMGQGLVVRREFPGFLSPTVLTLSDDVGGVSSGATGVRTLGHYSFEDTFLAVLDNDVATLHVWTGSILVQLDLDEVTAGTQGIDLSGTAAAGIRVVGRTYGAIPD